MNPHSTRIPGYDKGHYFDVDLDNEGLQVRNTTYEFISLDIEQTIELLEFLSTYKSQLEAAKELKKSSPK